MAKASDQIETSSGLVIGAVFSLADSFNKPDETFESSQQVGYSSNEYEKFLSNSPVPIKHCSVRVKNFIENDLKNKLTEACNNAIVKQEPEPETEATNAIVTEKDKPTSAEDTCGRPSRKRKPNTLFSSDYLLKTEEIREYAKSRKKKLKSEVTCQIDRDLIMSVAEKCLPEIAEKAESKDDIKMVSILPPTLKINISDTPVLVDWKEKVAKPLPEVVYSRPQTAKTKKKLRTQEQIDSENAEKRKPKKSRPRPKSKARSKKTVKPMDSSPPHLEPYGGQNMNNVTSSQSTSRLDGLPPQLKPYEIANSEEGHLSKIRTEATGTKSIKNIAPEREDKESSGDRIPCSLTGRMRKPNQQFASDYLTDFSKLSKITDDTKSKGKDDNDCETNTTLNHEDNSVHVTMLPNSPKSSTISLSASMPRPLNTANQFAGQMSTTNVKYTSQTQDSGRTSGVAISQDTKKLTSSKKLSSAIGELAKMENTKKFFQLVVGDKVVLIPTNGDGVVPKAFVMDIASTKGALATTPVGGLKANPTQTSRNVVMNVSSSGLNTIPAQPTGIQSLVNTQSARPITIASKISPPGLQSLSALNAGTTTNSSLSGVSSVKLSTPKNTAHNTCNMTLLTPGPSGSPKSTVIKMPIQNNPSQKIVVPVQKSLTPLITSVSPTAPVQKYVTVKTPFGNVGQKIIMPFVSRYQTLSQSPYPTNIVTNVSSAGQSGKTPILTSVLSDKKEPTHDLTVPATSVKKEPDNIREYEKAAEAFKGVPDEESDDETKKSERLSAKLNVHVPEVGSHVPASESVTGERIRKLKERLREQQLQLENIRKKAKDKTDDGIS